MVNFYSSYSKTLFMGGKLFLYPKAFLGSKYQYGTDRTIQGQK